MTKEKSPTVAWLCSECSSVCIQILGYGWQYGHIQTCEPAVRG